MLKVAIAKVMLRLCDELFWSSVGDVEGTYQISLRAIKQKVYYLVSGFVIKT